MEITRQMVEYERYLRRRGFAQNTIESYVWVAAYFERTYGEVCAETLAAYRSWLSETYKPVTANQRVQAINCYLTYLGHIDLKLRSVCTPQVTFLEEALGDEEYQRFTCQLKQRGHLRDYHAVRLMVTTGVRVSELLGMEVEDLRRGYVDIRSKGKYRRVHVPDAVAADALAWVEGEGRTSGRLLLNQSGRPITARGLSQQLKTRARECGIDERLVHPHSFRHLFARHFLEAGGDIVFLADLLGHTSVETTRIYLRKTSTEQRAEVNRLVTW